MEPLASIVAVNYTRPEFGRYRHATILAWRTVATGFDRQLSAIASATLLTAPFAGYRTFVIWQVSITSYARQAHINHDALHTDLTTISIVISADASRIRFRAW